MSRIVRWLITTFQQRLKAANVFESILLRSECEVLMNWEGVIHGGGLHISWLCWLNFYFLKQGFFEDDFDDYNGGGFGFGGRGGRGGMRGRYAGMMDDRRNGPPGSQYISKTGHSVHMRGLPFQAQEQDIFEVCLSAWHNAYLL